MILGVRNSKPIGKKRGFARSKSRGARQVPLEQFLLKALKNFHNRNPNHEMFGDFEMGKARAPYKVEHKMKVSWVKRVKDIAKQAKDAGIDSLQDAKDNCWMAHSSQITLNRAPVKGEAPLTGNARSKKFRSIKTVRFLAFLKNPTDSNYQKLDAGDEKDPFDHFCQRGELTDSAQAGKVCINGLYHGEFSTPEANESRKLCKNGALCLCPGHGPRNRKCIFTHPDGKLKPCRNNPKFCGPCKCPVKCFE